MPDTDDKPQNGKAAKPRKHKRLIPAPWNFPRNPLEEAIRIPRALEDKFAGNPTLAEDLAKAVGFNKAEDWRFQSLLLSANQYGLVNGRGARATVEMAPIGEDVVAPSDPAQRKKALEEAFRNVELFAQVADFYGDKAMA
jgi:hypothetical protein